MADSKVEIHPAATQKHEDGIIEKLMCFSCENELDLPTSCEECHIKLCANCKRQHMRKYHHHHKK